MFIAGVSVLAVALAAGIVESISNDRKMPNVSIEYKPHITSLFKDESQRKHVIAQLRLALKVNFDNAPEIHYLLGLALLEVKELDDAINHFRSAIRIMPNPADAHYHLAVALGRHDRIDESIDSYVWAAALKPKSADMRSALANALARADRRAEAIKQYGELARLRPDSHVAFNAIAWLMATDPKSSAEHLKLAVDVAERAAQLTEQRDASCLDTLAVTYAAVGRFDDAVAVARRALTLTQDQGLTDEITAHLRLFEQRKTITPG